MTEEERRTLKAGDMIRNVGTGQAFIVIESNRGHVLAVRPLEVSSPGEWEIVARSESVVRESDYA